MLQIKYTDHNHALYNCHNLCDSSVIHSRRSEPFSFYHCHLCVCAYTFANAPLIVGLSLLVAYINIGGIDVVPNAAVLVIRKRL